MTLAQFRDAVSKKLGLDNDPSTEQPDIDRWVNEGVTRVLLDTQCYIKETVYSNFDGTSVDYTIDPAILEISDLYISSGGTNYPIERLGVPDLINRRRQSAPTNTPTLAYALAGANLLMFWPAPSADAQMSVWYLPVPTALSASSDDPSTTTLGGIPTQLHKAIEYWACKEGAEQDDSVSKQQGKLFMDNYTAEITRYQKFLRRRGGLINQRAEVNAKRRLRVPHTNDIYWSGGGWNV
jgi:hypothetical protein